MHIPLGNLNFFLVRNKRTFSRYYIAEFRTHLPVRIYFSAGVKKSVGNLHKIEFFEYNRIGKQVCCNVKNKSAAKALIILLFHAYTPFPRLFGFIIKITVTIPLKVGVCNLFSEFFAHTFVRLCPFKLAGAVTACAFKSFFYGFYNIFVFI